MSLESENDLLKEITDNGANISPILPENIKKRTESRLRNCGGKLTPEHCKKISISQI